MYGFEKLTTSLRLIMLLSVVAVAIWAWWWLPKREVAKLQHTILDPKQRVDVEDTLRKTIGQALVAIIVLVGTSLAFVRLLEQRDTDQAQIATSQELLLSNQIANGFRQLGSDKIETRLGGIYTLESILHMQPPDRTTLPDYQQLILETLYSFIRSRTSGKNKNIDEYPATDVQAVLTVIMRRPKDSRSVDLSGAVVPGAHLSFASLRGADLIGANLSRASLSHATLTNANLSNADLSHTDLTGADLTNADLSHTDLTDTGLGRANLTDANLIDADELTQTQLDKACGIDAKLPLGLTLKPCQP